MLQLFRSMLASYLVAGYGLFWIYLLYYGTETIQRSVILEQPSP